MDNKTWFWLIIGWSAVTIYCGLKYYKELKKAKTKQK